APRCTAHSFPTRRSSDLDPHAVWLLERGMKTLAIRMERHNTNGAAVAAWAETHPGIARVHYPGLASHPDHETARRILHGFGGMIDRKSTRLNSSHQIISY